MKQLPHSMNPNILGHDKRNRPLFKAIKVDSQGVSTCSGCGKLFNLLGGVIYPTIYTLRDDEEQEHHWGYLQYCTLECCLIYTYARGSC